MGKRLCWLGAMLSACLLASCGRFPTEVPAEWVLKSPPEGNSLQLIVAVGLPCNRLQPVEVDETASGVTVNATVQLSDEPCDSMFVSEDVEVTLDRQLGDRMLLGCEAPSGEAVRLDLTNPECREVSG